MKRLLCTAAAGLALAIVPSLTAPASATGSFWGTVVDQGTVDDEQHYLVEDSCDVPGLTTQVDIIIHGTYVYRAVGRDRLPYVSEHWVLDHTFTNVANGKYVTIHLDLWEDDVFVKDNRDGTNAGLTVSRVYSEIHDADGRKLEYESTWTLSRWSKDNGDTPRDPRDDEWLDWVDLRQGGHFPDYCAATVAAVADPGPASRSDAAPHGRTLAPLLRSHPRIVH